MADQNKSEPPASPRQAGGELIIPVLAFGFAVYYLTTIWNSPWTAQVNAFLVGSILIACIAVFAVRTARDRLAGTIRFGFADLVAPKSILGKRLIFAGLTLGYIIVLEFVGFSLATFGFIYASILLLHGGRRWLIDAGASLLAAVAAYILFIAAFATRLPSGPIEALLKPFLP